jgi:hypothetical protein
MNIYLIICLLSVLILSLDFLGELDIQNAVCLQLLLQLCVLHINFVIPCANQGFELSIPRADGVNLCLKGQVVLAYPVNFLLDNKQSLLERGSVNKQCLDLLLLQSC